MKKYSIENRAIHEWGVTDVPELCVWLTKDRTMINGSMGGYQRDRDHREIAQFFSRSKFEDPGSSYIYLKKFMRRGNIRTGCNECGYYMEIVNTPTQAQLDQIFLAYKAAEEDGIEFGIGKRDPKDFSHITQYSFQGYIRFLNRYCRPAYSLLKYKSYVNNPAHAV